MKTMIGDGVDGFVFVMNGPVTLLGKLHADIDAEESYLEPVYEMRTEPIIQPNHVTRQMDVTGFSRALHPVLNMNEVRRVEIPSSGVFMVRIEQLDDETRGPIAGMVRDFELAYAKHMRSKALMEEAAALEAKGSGLIVPGRG